MKENEEEKKEFEKALFKYGLIAPLVEKIKAKSCEYGEISELIKKFLGNIKSIPYSGKKSLSRATLYNYIVRFLKNGFDGLKQKKRSDCGKSRKLKEDVLQKAIELKKENPERSTLKVIRLLKHNGITNIKYGSLHKNFQQLGLTQKIFHQGEQKPTHHFIREFANELWQSDVKYSLWLYQPERKIKMQTRLIVFIDKASRIIPHAEFYWRDNLPALENCFIKAIIKRGIPDAVYMDNQSIFRSEFFQAVCMELGCRVLYTQPYSPQSKGTVESFIGFVESDFLTEARVAGIQTLEELNHFFFAWLELEYHEKVHSGLGETPNERYQKDIARIRIVDIETLHEKFLYRAKRKVTGTCLVKIFGKEYLVDEKLAFREVEVRYDYFDQKEIYIYAHGEFMQKAYKFVPGKYSGIKPKSKSDEPQTKQQIVQSARSYLENLALIYQRTLQQGDSLVLTEESQTKKPKALKYEEFTKYLQLALGRENFSEIEQKEIENYFQKYGPFLSETVKQALLSSFSKKGKSAHISYYLQQIVKYHQKKGEK